MTGNREVLEVLDGIALSDALPELNQKLGLGLKDLKPNIVKYIDENKTSLMSMAK